MKVSELIEFLKDADPNDIVVIAEDEEGNNYREPFELCVDGYNYSEGEIGLRVLTPELESEGFTEGDLLDGIPCAVLT